jgi:hypothetical protein
MLWQADTHNCTSDLAIKPDFVATKSSDRNKTMRQTRQMPQTQSQSVTHNHKAFLETTAPNFIRRQFFGAKFFSANFLAPLILRHILASFLPPIYF